MNIIDRYIAKTFLSGYLILLLIGIGLYVLTDMMLNADEFTGDKSLPLMEVLRLMADYYLCNLPLYYSQLGGPLMAIAAAFTLAMMLRNNELTAIVAAGVPLQRLIVPLLACSLFLVGAWVANRELLMPRLAPQIARKHDDIIGRRTRSVECARDANNAILTADVFYPRTGRLEGVYIIEPDENSHPRNLIQADAAKYDAKRKTWVLERGVRIVMQERRGMEGFDNELQREFLQEYPFALSPEELVLRRDAQWSDLLSLNQLSALLQSPNLPNRRAVDMTRHIRLTQPLLQWILLLLAVPFFLIREPANVMVAGGKALLLTGAFYVVAFIAHGDISVGKNETIAALISWIPILFFGPIAALQLANTRT
jgi:lipopolysaccharide export system permease protein